MTEFCSKCGGLLLPEKKGKNIYLICRRCEKKTRPKQKKKTKIFTESAAKKENIIVLDKKKNLEVWPTTTAQCPKCGYKEAYWWSEHTQSQEGETEAQTVFRCKRCGRVWRGEE